MNRALLRAEKKPERVEHRLLMVSIQSRDLLGILCMSATQLLKSIQVLLSVLVSIRVEVLALVGIATGE
jgi:hypothetical protein